MSFRQNKLDRIDQVIALCVKNGMTPEKNTFASFVIKTCCIRFGLDESTARSYLRTIITAWRGDRWKYNVKGNGYLSPEETKKWIQMQ